MSSHEHRNGSAGTGRAARIEAANRRLEDNEASRRHWRRLRATIDTLLEIRGAAVGAEGVDRITYLHLFNDAAREFAPILIAQADLALAEALDLERGSRYSDARTPTPEEVSETRRRLRRERGEDSQPGRKK